MYCADEPSAIFHGLHQAHRKRVMEEQAERGLADLGSPMLLLVLLHGEKAGRRWPICFGSRRPRWRSP